MRRTAAALLYWVATAGAVGWPLSRDYEGQRAANDLQARLARAVSGIINEYLGTRSVVMFADEVRSNELGQRLLSEMAHPRLLVSAATAGLRSASNGLIVHLQEGGGVGGYDTVLSRLPSSDHSRHAVLWTDGPSANGDGGDRVDLHRIQAVFESFWQYQLVDVAVLVPMKATGSVRAYTFNPYSGSRCNAAGPPILTNIWSGRTHAFLKPDRVFGLDDKLKDLHKCPLKCLSIHRPPVSIVIQTQKGFQLTGSGLHIIDFMQKHMNFTGIVSVVHSHRGKHFSLEKVVQTADNDSTPVYEQVKTKKVDLAFGRFTRIFDSASDVEFIKEDQMDCFTWGLPSGIGHDPTLWINYVAEFSPVTWVLIVFAVFLAFVVVIIFSRLTFWPQNSMDVKHAHPPTLINLLFYTYATFIGAPVKFTPKSYSLQMFLSIWLLYSLVVTSSYQAYLGSLITIPQTTPEINDQHSLLKTNLNLVGRQEMYYLINSSAGSSNDFKTLVDRYQIMPPEDFSYFIRRILMKRDIAVLASKRELIFYAQRYKKIFNDSKRLHVLPKCIIESYSSTFMLRKGSPFRHRIGTIMSRLSETGIMQQWDRANVKEELVHGIVFTEDTILSMSQFYGAFVVLICGCFVGFCTFVGEIIVFFINTNNSKTSMQLQFLN